jgi:hypothetical protein
LSFNVSIDGTALSQSHFEGVYGCCTGEIPALDNFTLYSIQNLPLGDHVLVLRLLDTSGYVFSAAVDASGSGSVLFFDYAVVNAPPSPYVQQFQFRRSNLIRLINHQRLGPALGGALGGTAALALTALTVIYTRRQAHKRGAEDPDNPIIISHKQEQEQPVIAAGLLHDYTPVPPLSGGSNTRTAAEHQLHAADEIPLTAPPLAASPSYQPRHHETPIPPTPQSRVEEDSLLLARMYRLGVPATEIARMAELMRTQG